MKNRSDLARDALLRETGRMVNYFYPQFVNAARLAARAATESEVTSDKPDPLVPDSEHFAHVTTAVVTSVTALEAWINEFYWDCADASDYLEGMNDDDRTHLGRLWLCPSLALERRPILDKYLTAMDVGLNSPTQPLRARSECADARALIRLRNALVHSKPTAAEFDESDASGKPSCLERSLHGRFTERPGTAGMPFFPHRCISAGCATWSVSAATKFIEAFQDCGGFTRSKIIASMTL